MLYNIDYIINEQNGVINMNTNTNRLEELGKIGEQIEKIKFQLMEMKHMRGIFPGNMDLFLKEKKMKEELVILQNKLRQQP